MTHTVKYNNESYSFGPTCDASSPTSDGPYVQSRKYQLFGVVLDSAGPFIIGAVASVYEGKKAWFPMKWDLFTGVDSLNRFNITPNKEGIDNE